MNTKKYKKHFIVFLVFLCVSIVALGYSYFIEPNRLVVNEHEILIDGLDPAFDGIRIAAVSDIHGGSNGGSAENIRKIVNTVNEQNVDMVVLLGDYLSQNSLQRNLTIEHRDVKMSPMEIVKILNGLSAKHGVFAVLGNHDGWKDKHQLIDEFGRSNIQLLQNQIGSIEYNGKTLRILGLVDHLQLNSWYSFNNDVTNILTNDGREGDIIVLQHSPDIFKVIEYYKNPWSDLRLMVSGHTHGGQVWLPILGRPMIPSSYGQKYAAGHTREEGKDLFVTTGTGTSLLPFRFMVPPEIALLTLRRSNK